MLETFLQLPERKQETIYDAAAQVFAVNGYHRANIAEICKLAGISNGALYKYFKNKSDLYIAVMRHCGVLFIEHIGYSGFDQGSFYQKLEELAKRTFSFCEEYSHYWTLYHDLGSPSMVEFASVLTSDVEDIGYQLLIDLVKQGEDAGEFRANIKVNEVASLLETTIVFASFTLISEHYRYRFSRYFGEATSRLGVEEKAAWVVRYLRPLLS